MNEMNCALCANDVGKNPTIEGKDAFCCHGCHAVYRILSVKNQLGNFQDNPIFLQATRSGLIANPTLLEQIRTDRKDGNSFEKEKIHLEIGEMWCPSCAEVIKLVLMREHGVSCCIVDYCTDLASIEFDPKVISKADILTLISGLDYKPYELLSRERGAVSRPLMIRFGIAAFFSINIMMFSYPIYATYFEYDPQGYAQTFAWISLLFSLPVVTYSAAPIFKRFWTSLLVDITGMEALVVMGVSAAFLLSIKELLGGGSHVYFDSMSVIITFVLLGKMIESKAKFSAKESIIRLSRSLPRRGRVVSEDGSEAFLQIKEIATGDFVAVLTGEKVVLDGIVVEGDGSCDESIMTGEAIPVQKRVNDPMLAGTILQQGRIVYRVTKTSEETALHKIVEMVEKDIGHKSAYVRAADLIVKWFVPTVIAFAIFVALFTWLFNFATLDQAVIRAVSILLISCPCAIGIAAPLAGSHIMQAMAKLGAIVRNRGCMASLGRETVFVFDKTGTITEGRFQVLSGLDTLDRANRALLKTLTSRSIHPISQAIATAIYEEPAQLSGIREHIGLGVSTVDYWVGSLEMLKHHKARPPLTISEDTTVFFGHKSECLAIITLGDRIRLEAKSVIQNLYPTKSVLLSGDSEKPVTKVAKVCNFDSYYWGCNPLDKRNHIDSLRENGEIVCMLGDGINDAPALTGAHIGISVVNASDVSIQISDILLTTDNLEVIPKIRAIAQRGQRIIKQNLFWVFSYNIIGILLAATGSLNPLYAAFAMTISSLIVLYNAKRVHDGKDSIV